MACRYRAGTPVGFAGSRVRIRAFLPAIIAL
jgi:hypothetical protein